MRSVAERGILSVLAVAERDSLGLFKFEFLRMEAAAFVRSVAKRLALGKAARAPPIDAGVEFENRGLPIGT